MQVNELQGELAAAEQRSRDHVATVTSELQHEAESLRAATAALGKQLQEISSERDQLSEQVCYCVTILVCANQPRRNCNDDRSRSICRLWDDLGCRSAGYKQTSLQQGWGSKLWRTCSRMRRLGR